jgi:type II secretory pathway component GspD/PulD (secretin)
MMKMVAEIYKHNSQVRVSTAPPNKLLVYADPQTQLEIHDLLNADPAPERQTAVIGLNRLDAASFVDELKVMMPDWRNNSPYLSADPSSNSIRVRGTADQIKEVRLLIRALDGAEGSGTVIHLDKRSGATVAEAIEMLLPRIRDNPINVVLPGRLGSPLPKAPEMNK